MNKAFLVLALALLSGCVNPYKQYYSQAPGADPVKVSAFSTKCSSAEIYRDQHEKDLIIKMYKNGYALIGSSAFNSGNVSKDDLIKFSQEIGACIVLVKSQYTHTEQGVYSVPQYVPGQSVTINTYGTAYAGGSSATYQGTSVGTTPGYFTSQYVPYSVARSDYLATYWVRLITSVFGTWGDRIPDDLRKKYNIDKGVFVLAVRNNSPADIGGLMDGDIIIKVNDTEVSLQNWDTISSIYAGKEVEVTLLRDGKSVIKKVSVGIKQ